MTKFKLEYIWLDGYEPVPNLRSKTKVVEFDDLPALEEIPMWGFDGSSTRQADGSDSDCMLQPVAIYPDPARTNGVLVMCEVMLPDGSPHPSNSRATIPDDPDTWFGFEQEYFLYRDGAPDRLPGGWRLPAPQGEYYTGVGYRNVGDVAREIVEAHLDLCLAAGIDHEGINAEVAKGQWEFQIFGKGSRKAADESGIARYLLLRLCERYGVDVNFHCKPLGCRGRLERLGHAHELLDQVPPRGRWQGVLQGADGRLRRVQGRAHRRVRPRQPPPADRAPRDAGDRPVQLRGRRIAAPRSACRTASWRTATGATSRTVARTRRAIRTRSPAGSSRRSGPCPRTEAPRRTGASRPKRHWSSRPRSATRREGREMATQRRSPSPFRPSRREPCTTRSRHGTVARRARGEGEEHGVSPASICVPDACTRLRSRPSLSMV